MARMTVWPVRGNFSQSEGVFANELVVGLGWAIDQSDGILVYCSYDISYDISANERVDRLGWTINQSEDILANENILRFWWGLDQL